MKKFFIVNVFIFTMTAIFASSLTVDKFFTDDEVARVLGGEIICRMCIAENAWGENTDLTMTIPATDFDAGGYSDWEMISDEKAFIPYELTDESKLRLLNVLVDFKGLTGMKYYSRKVDQILELITEAHRIKSATNYSKVPTVTYTEVPEHLTNFFTQKDNRFGRTYYQSDIYFDGDNVAVINSNVLGMNYVLPINRKGEFKSITYMIYSQEHKGFFYYTANPMRIRIKPALSKLSPTTFAQRLRAVTVHLALGMGLDWSDKYQPYDNEKLKAGEYKNY